MSTGAPADPGRKIAVVGAGSWGTAFANALANKGLKVTIWSRRAGLADKIQNDQENPDYLPGVFLSPRLRATSDLQAAVDRAGTVVMAVPSQGFRAAVAETGRLAPPDAPIVNLAKGLEAKTLCRMSEVIAQEVPAVRPGRIAVLSGPNLSKEIAAGQPSASVVACTDLAVMAALQELFMSPVFRTYSNPDVTGVELAGVTKNIIAIATGIAEGLGFGSNAQAAVMTRGLAEMTRLGAAAGAEVQTFYGLAGAGDLMCTCMSPLSRNHHVGVELGKGLSIDQILAPMHEVAEGVESSKAVFELATRHGVYMPISAGVYRVIHEGQEINEMVGDLLRTVRRSERD